MADASLVILLSTYNGSAYLPAFLESLEQQTYQNWQLLVRDDGSSDDTVATLEQFQNIHPQQISIMRDDEGNLGSYESYMKLLESANSDYIVFADQDDVWLPHKITSSLSKIKELERMHGTYIPLLVFTDLIAVDKDLNTIHPSFWQYQKLNPDIAYDWKKLLAQNVITGCTMLINQEAKKVCLPASLPMMIPDHWIGVQVSRYGKVSYVSAPTLLYRQHGNNVAGVHKFGYRYVIRKFKDISQIVNNYKIYANYYGDINVWQLIMLKITLNLKRLL